MRETTANQTMIHQHDLESEQIPYLSPAQSADQPVSQLDIEWALHFEKQVHLGLSPSFQDIEKYSAIFNCLETQNHSL